MVLNGDANHVESPTLRYECSKSHARSVTGIWGCPRLVNLIHTAVGANTAPSLNSSAGPFPSYDTDIWAARVSHLEL